MNSLSEHTTDAREYLRVLRARKYGVLLITAITVAVTMVLTFQQTPLYEGEAKVLVQPLQNPYTTTITNPGAFAPNLETEREIVRSQAVAEEVQRTLGITVPVEELLDDLDVDVVTDTDVLIMRYRHRDPTATARRANAFAAAYIAFRRQQGADQIEAASLSIEQRITSVQAELTGINRQIGTTPEGTARDALITQRDTLITRLGVLQQQLINLPTVEQGGGQVVQRAEVPSDPVSPSKVRNGLLALFGGLALGVGLAFLRERLDDRVKDREEVERRLDAPVIAAVPRLSGWRRGQDPQLVMLSDPQSPVSEAYRTLGTNIQYLASREPLKILMITSAVGGEGKTTTASNLAVALSRAGKRVIIISADLRRPRLHQFFDVTNEIGLVDILADSTPLAMAAKQPQVANLRVIAGGPIPQDPAALLGSQRAADFIGSLREMADYVILDAPPVLAVADASILAPLVDGTVYVADAEQSSRSAMRHARDQLENAGARIVGAVYNNFDPAKGAGASSYYYYYQYYGTPENGQNGSPSKGRVRGRRRTESSESPGSMQAPEAELRGRV